MREEASLASQLLTAQDEATELDEMQQERISELEAHLLEVRCDAINIIEQKKYIWIITL